ncbi:MAG TPA: trypsin-like peptidase domain-containing protein [Phycisphaerae bacterium]|nr:trypsin-like peptidase domain-containing protein [Phycisphaerae bacterium]
MTRRYQIILALVFAIGVTLVTIASTVAVGHSPGLSTRSSEHPLTSVFDRASAAVVKLYGPGAGREHGYGTGVLVSPDGRIVTALSLMVSTGKVQVILADGRRLDGKLVRSDENRQLALLKIDGGDLPFLAPHASKHLQIGDAVVALGNWFKIAEGREAVSMNRGILSFHGPVATRRLAQQFDYAGPLLIFDAITANPGAAGGPLLDLSGNFVGLVGKIVEAENTFTRINFALPAEELTAFLGGEVASRPAGTSPDRPASVEGQKPYIGIKLAKLGYRHVSAFVDRVRPGSPAETAGVRADDLILAIDGRRISSAESYEEVIRELVPGQSVPLTIKRGAQLITLNVTVGAEP